MLRIHWAILLSCVALGQDSTPRKLIESMNGRDLFTAYCASCHGLDGKGGGPVAPALKLAMPDLTTVTRRNRGVFPRDEIEKLILGVSIPRAAHGSEMMPVWGPVFRKVENDKDYGLVRVRRLVEFISSLQRK